MALWPLEVDPRAMGHEEWEGKGSFQRDVADGVRSLHWSKSQGTIELPASPFHSIGTDDFTLSVWVHLATSDPMGGDILTGENSAGDRFNLAVVTRTGSTSSLSADRQLCVMLGNPRGPHDWQDRGRVGSAIYVNALSLFEGSLFAGVCQPKEGERGEVFRYVLQQDGTSAWQSVGSPDASNAVTSLAPFAGRLYAGTGHYRLGGSSLPDSPNLEPGGCVYRWDGARGWQKMGELPGAEAVGGLVVYEGRLFASSLYRPARLYSLDTSGSWKEERLPEAERRVESMSVFEGQLYATSYDNAHVYRLHGGGWHDLGSIGDNTQTYGFAAYRGYLHVSTWPSGRVYRLTNSHWQDVGRLGEELEVMGLASYGGSLFGGTLPSGDVYQMITPGDWRKSGNVDATPGVKYRRAWTMAVHEGELFVGTLPSGHVQSMRIPGAVSWDEPFPKGWHHVAVRRSGTDLSLSVDGKIRAKGQAPSVSLASLDRWTLGAGDHDLLSGAMRDLRLERGVRSDDELIMQSRQRPVSSR